MEKDKIIHTFLNISDIETHISSMKTWTWLYIAFTLLFMDVGVLINYILPKQNNRLMVIPIVFTIIIFVIIICYFVIRKKVFKFPSWLFFYQAMVQIINAIMFFCLCAIILIQENHSFLVLHFIITSISLVTIIAVLIFRINIYRTGRIKKLSSAYYIGTVPIVLAIIPFFKKFMEQFDTGMALSVVVLILGFVWLLIGLINAYNFIVARINSIDDEFN